jgi:hypothetical protein
MSDTAKNNPKDIKPKGDAKPIPQRDLYPLREASVKLGGISIATIYRMASDGKIKLSKIGDRSFVSASEIARLSA